MENKGNGEEAKAVTQQPSGNLMVPAVLCQMIVNYLQMQPYQDVVQLINGLAQCPNEMVVKESTKAPERK